MTVQQNTQDYERKPTVGSRILDIIAGAARGYGEGAGNANIPEAAFARSFSSGYENGKEINRQNRIRDAINKYKASPEYAGLSDSEKSLYDVAPGALLEARVKRDETIPKHTEPTTKVMLSQINPKIPPNLDREIEIPQSKLD